MAIHMIVKLLELFCKLFGLDPIVHVTTENYINATEWVLKVIFQEADMFLNFLMSFLEATIELLN